jgi:hypothetical protein
MVICMTQTTKFEVPDTEREYGISVEHLPSGNVVLRQGDQVIVISPRWVYDVTRSIGQWVQAS